jgi:ParB/RepB/Spo0J family partition protein
MAIRCEGIVRRKDIYMVDPRSIHIEEGWNPRATFGTPEDAELIESIRSEGVKVPILIIKTKDDRLILRDGERRFRAVMSLIGEGLEDILIPAEIVSATALNEIEGLKQALLRNTGKPLTMSEEANAFSRLQNYGLSAADIARAIGKSPVYVGDRLILAQAAPKVREAVDGKQIYMAQARSIVVESDGSIEAQEAMLQHAIEEREDRKAERFEKVRETWKAKNKPVADGDKEPSPKKTKATSSGLTRKRIMELVPQLAEEIIGQDTNGLDKHYIIFAKGKLAAYCEILGIDPPAGVSLEL